MMNPQRDKDNDLIDEAEDLPVPSQQGSGGGNMSRQVGQRDEGKTATGEDPELTKVQKSDKAEKGDMPSPPQGRE